MASNLPILTYASPDAVEILVGKHGHLVLFEPFQDGDWGLLIFGLDMVKGWDQIDNGSPFIYSTFEEMLPELSRCLSKGEMEELFLVIEGHDSPNEFPLFYRKENEEENEKRFAEFEKKHHFLEYRMQCFIHPDVDLCH